MTTLTPHLSSLSNWERYTQKYNPAESDTLSIETRIADIEDPEVQGRLKEYINIQLGMLLLAHHEVDSQKSHDILNMFQ